MADERSLAKLLHDALGPDGAARCITTLIAECLVDLPPADREEKLKKIDAILASASRQKKGTAHEDITDR